MKFRPRFSVRTLAIVVTVLSAYFAAWEATKKYGLEDGLADDLGYPVRETALAPFIVMQVGWFEGPRNPLSSPFGEIRNGTRFFVWLFGPKIKFPVELPIFEEDRSTRITLPSRRVIP